MPKTRKRKSVVKPKTTSDKAEGSVDRVADRSSDPRRKSESYANALDRHSEVLNVVHQAVELGRSGKADPDPKRAQLIKNSCDWVIDGPSRLNVLTETHDASRRARKQGAAGSMAMCGVGVARGGRAAYNQNDLTDPSGTMLMAKGCVGSFKGGVNLVMSQGGNERTRDDILSTIVHETQHDADRHDDALGGDRGPAWNEYATEFRAYWIEGEYSDKSETALTGKPPEAAKGMNCFDNDRQLAIFDHIYKGYPKFRQGWDTNPEELARKVAEMPRPVGINLVNSIRVNDLYTTLAQFVRETRKMPWLARIRFIKRRVIERKGRSVHAMVDALTDDDKKAFGDDGMKEKWTFILEDPALKAALSHCSTLGDRLNALVDPPAR